MQAKALNWGAISKYRCEIMGVACLWVILHHFTGDLLFHPLKRLSVYGNAGVDIFLFLSGIGLYFAFQKNVRLSTFYKKRIVRLLIPYLLICVPYYIWLEVYAGEGNLWLNITQLSFPLSHMITTWYVPAMLLFYLLFPLVYKVQNDAKVKNRNVWVLFLSLSYLMFLLLLKNACPAFYNNTEIALTRFVIFFVGCYCAKAVYEKKRLHIEEVAISAASILLSVLLRETNGLSAFWIRMSYVPLAIAICILLAFGMTFLKENSILLKILRFFGNRSLEIYLTHVLIINVWKKTVGIKSLDPHGVIDYLAIVAISIITSVLAHVLIQKISALVLNHKGVASH